MGILHLATVICASVSQLLLLVALSSNYWLDTKGGSAGLWKGCRKYTTGISCSTKRLAVEDYHNPTRAFLILAVIAGFIACGLLYFLFYRSQIRSFSVAKIAGITSFLAGLLALVAMAIYTKNERRTKYYGWSFFVGWLGGIFFLVTGGLALKLNRGTAS